VTIDGVFPPIPTPFSNDTVDVLAMGGNVDRWMQTGIRGVVVLGSNGEAPFLSEFESDAAVAAAREHVPSNRLCIAGVGRESTIETIRATKRAADLGVDAVLARTPSFFKGFLTPDAFIGHYTAVAEESPIPLLLYNFTAVTGVTLPVEVVSMLAGHPNIVGMKESGSDLKYVSALINSTPDDFVVLAGSAPVFYPSLLVGATGGVLALASVAPDLCVELYDLVQSGRHSEARELQRRLTPLAGLVTSKYGVPGLKAALFLLGFHVGEPRLPLQPIKSEAIDEVRIVLNQLGLLSSAHSPA
tara:strand:- start:457 stop:1359 length:903 start_codon:yes stop_codon:yes gene_type:complete